MPRLSMSELTTYRWTFEVDVQRYAAAGYQAIGVWRPKLVECGEERGIDCLLESGLAVSSLMWAGGFTGSDGRTYSFSLDDALEALRLASVIRAGCLVVYSGGRGGHTHGHARRLVYQALRELAQAAAELDVTLAIEPMHAGCGWEWTFLNGIDDALELIGEVPGLKMVFDLYHWGYDERLQQRMARLVPHIALVQLADAASPPCGEQDRLPLGTGSLPLRQWAQQLIEHGYDGYFETELLGPEIEALCYDALLANTLEAMGNLSGVNR
jgi:sugar phosphate isomerase/epimerase